MNLAHLVWDTPSQTDSYYLLKDPEARVANYTPHNSPNQWKKKRNRRKQLPAILLPVSEDRHHVRLTEKEREQEREIEMKQSSPYVKSDWNILAISHRLAYIRPGDLGKAI